METGAGLGRQGHQAKLRGLEPREFPQRHIVERAPYGGVDPLPSAAHPALPLDAAAAGGAAAFRDRDGSLEHVEDLGRRDLLGAPREEMTSPARCRPFNTLLTVGRLKRVVCASSAAARCRDGSCAKLARTTVA